MDVLDLLRTLYTVTIPLLHLNVGLDLKSCYKL